MDQAALRDFINEGHLTRHIRRIRVLYADRQAALVKAAARELAGLLEVGPADAGMHLVGWLPEGVDDWAASQRACALGVETQPLSWHCLNPAGLPRGGLLLGDAAIDEKQINRGVLQLKLALQISGDFGLRQ
jgi:GntR family transcriptional regulator/MocR family aminotransferase